VAKSILNCAHVFPAIALDCHAPPYDPNQPIEMLFQQIQDARAFAVAGGQPYGAAMIVNVAYTLIFNTGMVFPSKDDAAPGVKPRHSEIAHIVAEVAIVR
jgi:hypothetical protein